MNDPITDLQQLGFSEYEARAYTTLLQRSPLNGYELAKQSGLPRANVYAVLQKLEERGAVVRLDTPEGTRYAPVPPEELVQRLRHHFQGILDAAQSSLSTITSSAEYDAVWNARGYQALLEHARSLLEAAQEQLLLAIWPQEAQALAATMAQAVERGVEVTTLCLAACPKECGGCQGQIYRYRVPPEQIKRWLVITADRVELLTGEIGPVQEALAVRTRHRLLVDLATWYIRHSIALAAVLRDVGGRLGSMLQPETRSVLATVGPDDQNGGWLEHMMRLVTGPSQEADSQKKE